MHSPTDTTRLIYVRMDPPFLLRLFLALMGTGFLAAFVFVLVSHTDRPDTIPKWIMTAGLLFFGYMSVQASAFKSQIRLDPVTRELVFISRGVFPRTSRRRVPTSGLRAVILREPG